MSRMLLGLCSKKYHARMFLSCSLSQREQALAIFYHSKLVRLDVPHDIHLAISQICLSISHYILFTMVGFSPNPANFSRNIENEMFFSRLSSTKEFNKPDFYNMVYLVAQVLGPVHHGLVPVHDNCYFPTRPHWCWLTMSLVIMYDC